VNLNSQFTENSNQNIPNEQIRLSIEQLLSDEEIIPKKNQFDLRILLCFMCGGENNDIEMFFSQLSSRFSLMVINQSFIINTFLGRSNRKVILLNKKKENYFFSNFVRLNLFLCHFIRYFLFN
jgi:hypothetical protein